MLAAVGHLLLYEGVEPDIDPEPPAVQVNHLTAYKLKHCSSYDLKLSTFTSIVWTSMVALTRRTVLHSSLVRLVSYDV